MRSLRPQGTQNMLRKFQKDFLSASKMSNIDSEVLDSTVFRLLGKAGLDPRCTPKILRSKTEQKLKLQEDELLPYRVRIKKLIIKWWKETQLNGNAEKSGEKRSNSTIDDHASQEKKKIKTETERDKSNDVDIDILTKYKAWRAYTRAVKRSDLLEGLTDIKDVDKKIQVLSQRLHTNGFKCNNTPTSEEITAAEQKYA